MRITAVAVGVCLLLLQGVVGQDNFVDDKDLALAAKAVTKEEVNCAVADKMDIDQESRASIREDLLDASGDNVILKVLESSASQDDLVTQMQDKALNPGFLIPKAGPLVAFFFLMGIYAICCCWGACPCCRCCRCFQRKRNIPFWAKLIVIVLLVVIVLGLLIAASLSMRGFNSAQQGFEVTSCTAAKMVNSAMNGQTGDTHFLGLIPTLQTFQDLKDSLDVNSQFITELTAVLTNTQKITDAVTAASATLKLLREFVAAPENQEPVSDAGDDLLHECTLCPHLESALTPAIDTLDGSIGSALDGARTEVEKQLSGDTLQSLQDSMMTASAPLIQLKASMHAAFGPFVELDMLQDVSAILGTYGTLGSVALIGFALLLSCCGFSTVTLWMCVEKKKGTEGAMEFRNHTHRCACCTWCSSCYYTMFAFFLGGLMTALCIPFASMCLVLEDVDKDMLLDISPAIGLNLSGDQGDMMTTMVEQCFRGKNGSNPAMLNMIYVRENGTKVTMYDMIVGQTKDQINASFQAIADMSGGSSTPPSLNSDPNIVTLKNTLRDAKMSSMMLPRSDEFQSGSNIVTYGAMMNDNNLNTYIASSADCGDFTVPAGMPKPDGVNTIPGVTTFSNALLNYDNGITHRRRSAVGCARKATCTADATLAACTSGNQFMDLKQGLLQANTFKCFRMKKANGSPCDIKDMYKSGGVWMDDCLVNGVITTESYLCNLATFTTQVQLFEQRLDKVFSRLDGATDEVMSDITVNMKGLVDQYVLDPITLVADGLTCGFLRSGYQGVIDGLCYGGVWGFKAMASAYVFCGVLTLFLIILMYIVWRLAIDNVEMSKGSPILKYDGGAK